MRMIKQYWQREIQIRAVNPAILEQLLHINHQINPRRAEFHSRIEQYEPRLLLTSMWRLPPQTAIAMWTVMPEGTAAARTQLPIVLSAVLFDAAHMCGRISVQNAVIAKTITNWLATRTADAMCKVVEARKCEYLHSLAGRESLQPRVGQLCDDGPITCFGSAWMRELSNGDFRLEMRGDSESKLSRLTI